MSLQMNGWGATGFFFQAPGKGDFRRPRRNRIFRNALGRPVLRLKGDIVFPDTGKCFTRSIQEGARHVDRFDTFRFFIWIGPTEGEMFSLTGGGVQGVLKPLGDGAGPGVGVAYPHGCLLTQGGSAYTGQGRVPGLEALLGTQQGDGPHDDVGYNAYLGRRWCGSISASLGWGQGMATFSR